MKTYNVSCNKLTYQLSDNNTPLGRLVYAKWYSQSAEIQTDKVYRISISGAFGHKIALKQENEIAGQSKLNWNMSMTVLLNGNEYTLKTCSLLSMDFVLLNAAKQPVMGINSTINWWNYDVRYSIHLPENQQEVFSPEDLLYLIHNCNYYMMMNIGRTETLSAS